MTQLQRRQQATKQQRALPAVHPSDAGGITTAASTSSSSAAARSAGPHLLKRPLEQQRMQHQSALLGAPAQLVQQVLHAPGDDADVLLFAARQGLELFRQLESQQACSRGACSRASGCCVRTRTRSCRC